MKRGNIAVMRSMIALVRPLWLWMTMAVLLGIAGFLCSILITVFGALAMVKVLGLADPFSWTTLWIALAVFGVGRGILRYGEQASNHYIAFKLLALVRDRVFSALRRLCPAKLEGKEKGNLISMLTSDVELLEVFYAHTISPVLIALCMSVLMSVLIACYHPLLGILAAFSYAAVGVFVPLHISKRCGGLGMAARNEAGSFSSFMLESLRGLDETLQYEGGERRLTQIRTKSERLSRYEGELRVKSGEGMALTNALILGLSLLMLAAAALLYQQQMLPLEGVLMSFVMLMSSFGPVTALANLGTTLQNTLASGSRILDLLEEEAVVKERQEGETVTGGDAVLDRVRFAYEQETILDDLSLTLPKQRMIGIQGKSGSGKSTILKLLMRFWDVDQGSVRIGGQNVKAFRTASLRDYESYMTQDTHLFHDTIENNIRLVKPDATHEEIVEACRKASLHTFIESLPQGYDTNVGELGDALSGGEKQRIGLARVFLHDADLLLLDEPTSNLDSLNEAIILKALDEQKQDKTIVLVSHRPSTLRLCDTCIHIESGRVS